MNNLGGCPSGKNSRWAWVLFMLLPVLLQACVTTPSGSSAEKLEARKKYDDADKAASVGQTEEQITHLKAAISLDPKEPLYHMVLGDVYFMNRQLDSAEKEYLTAIKADPNFSDTYGQLGRLYMVKSQWDDAIRYLDQAVSSPNLLNPLRLYNWLALSYYGKGDMNRAEKVWLKALGVKDNGQIRLHLALIYIQAERYDLARESLVKAVEQDESLVRGHFELAQLYLKSRHFADAREHFARVVRLEPLGELAQAAQEYLKLMPKVD